MKKYSLNDYVIIYPNAKGWERIREILKEMYNDSESRRVEDIIKIRTTHGGGYKEQLWCVIAELSDMFYNGSMYFETTFIDMFIAD